MAEAALKATVGADVAGFVSGMKAAENAAAGLNDAVKKVGNQYNFTNDQVQQSTFRLKDNERILSTATKAQQDLGTAASKSAVELKKAGESAGGGFVSGVNSAYSAVRRLAYILPGIGIAGIFNLAFEGIASAFSSQDKAIDDTTKKLEDYNKLVLSIAENNTKEAATVDILVGKIQSGTLSRQETVQAIKELQKIAPDYFSKLNAEKASIEDVTKAYGAYNNQIVKTIEAQIRIAEITALVKDRLNQSAQTPEAAKFIADLQAQGKTLEEINAIVVKGTGEDIRAQAQLLAGSKNVTDEQLKQALLTSKIPAGVQIILSLLQKEADLVKQINGSDIKNLVKLDKPKAEKEPDRITQEPVDIKDFLNTSNFDENIKTIQKKLDKNPMVLEWTFDTNTVSDQLKELSNSLGRILSGFTGDLSIAVSEAIGTAIGSGGNVIKAAGNAAEKQIGELLKSLGAAMIKYATYQEIAINLANVNPVLGFAAGVAAEVIGSALVAGAGKGIHAFAEGGIVTGPTNALIGEAGPEVIFPLAQLNKFVKANSRSQDMNVSVAGEISGNNLRLVLARANRYQSRV